MPQVRKLLLGLGILAFGVLCYLLQSTDIADARQPVIAVSPTDELAFLPYTSGESANPQGTSTVPGMPTPTTISTSTPSPTATATPTTTLEPSITPTSTATVTQTPRPTATQTALPTATLPPGNTGDIRITKIFFDGAVPQTEDDEYVEIKNFDTRAIRLQGWKLHDDGPNHTYTFPNYLIQPGQTCRVYTNESHAEWCNLNWGNGSAIWNNDGDTATLKDGNGKVISGCSYEGSGTTATCP